MPLLDNKQFSKITHRNRCDHDVIRQIREFVIITMIPQENVVLNHCIVTVPDLSNRKLLATKPTRFFDVVFYVMYYQIGQTFVGNPVLEITYDAAEELTRDEFERRRETLPGEKVLQEAKEIINPIYKTEYNG